ncbi:MAG TPA: WD40 repeat domain-containing protein [Methylomirabilota bacterium]|nr:WD40 repeat domain-containing protein [Methylomirabilota bacterium]
MKEPLLNLFVVACLLGEFAPLRAQTSPDILWQTNGVSGYYPSAVAVSSDSRFVVSGWNDGNIKVWNATNSNLVRGLGIPTNPRSVALSSDGSTVAAGEGGGKTRLWQVSDGARLWIGGPDDGVVYAVPFSPDDSLIALGRTDGINLRYSENGNGIFFGEPPSSVFSLCFSPEGQWLASANEDFNASLWRVPEGTLVHNFVGHSNAVTSVDFAPDGLLLATASADGTARVWDATTGESLLVLEGGGGIAKFSANGSLLFTLGDGTFKIWRVSSGSCIGSITNTGALCFDIAKNGKYFTYGRGDGALVLARTPVVLDKIIRTGNQTILAWQGGSGRYRLQSRTNLLSGSWENVGGTTTNVTVTNISSATLFFRVQSLPIP